MKRLVRFSYVVFTFRGWRRLRTGSDTGGVLRALTRTAQTHCPAGSALCEGVGVAKRGDVVASAANRHQHQCGVIRELAVGVATNAFDDLRMSRLEAHCFIFG